MFTVSYLTVGTDNIHFMNEFCCFLSECVGKELRECVKGIKRELERERKALRVEESTGGRICSKTNGFPLPAPSNG